MTPIFIFIFHICIFSCRYKSESLWLIRRSPRPARRPSPALLLDAFRTIFTPLNLWRLVRSLLLGWKSLSGAHPSVLPTSALATPEIHPCPGAPLYLHASALYHLHLSQVFGEHPPAYIIYVILFGIEENSLKLRMS